MMTQTPEERERAAAGAAAWRSLVRKVVHRTSAPTDDLVRRARMSIGNDRGSMPNSDAVIAAALRLANRSAASRAAWAAEVERVEHGYPAPNDDAR